VLHRTLDRAISMYVSEGQLRFSPSDLANYLESEFASWMDRWHAEANTGPDGGNGHATSPAGDGFPGAGECRPNERDEQLELISARGQQHEADYLGFLRGDGRRITEFGQQQGTLPLTLAAMRAGADVVFQGRLEHETLAGYADFLVRCDGPSDLGAHHYEVWDTKLSRSAKPTYVIQLCAYSELLERLQSRRPEGFEIVLGDRSRLRFRTHQFYFYYQALKRGFLEFHGRFDPEQMPHPGQSRSFGRWSDYATQYLEGCDHLSRVANITRIQIRKLEDAEIATMTGLASSKQKAVPHLDAAVLNRLRKQARLQIESRDQPRPVFEIHQPEPGTPRCGLALLPPASNADVYFDMEGFPLHDGGLEYLFGAVYLEAGEPRFRDWWAHDALEEKRAFEGFIDWVHARWQRDPSLHIYHYANYEVAAVRRLMGKYATREAQVDDLLRNKVFVDLYGIVRSGLIVGTPSYSLKDIERLYMEARCGAITTAGGSIVAYHRWLESGEGRDPGRSPILQEIRHYNEDDCHSTRRLAEWLRGLQAGADREADGDSSCADSDRGTGSESAGDQRSDDDSAEAPRENPAKALAAQLLEEVESGQIKDPECCRIQQLLGWLLEFHWREAKPVFWRMFDRSAMTEEQLIEDLDCLGGLRRTKKPPTPVKKSRVVEYRFPIEQETKLAAGSRCMFAHDLNRKPLIESLDVDSGLVELRFGPSIAEIPNRLNLIPNEHVPADEIAKAVYRYTEGWRNGTSRARAVDDLLQRNRPRIRKLRDGPLIAEGQELLPAVVGLIERMDETVLCIQGPPGTGKTYTCAQAILKLLRAGRRIAVTANGHKAILNILRAVHEAVRAAGEEFVLLKVGGETDDPLLESGDIQHVPQSGDAAGSMPDGACVVGGTAWVFSRAELEGEFDHLFVDEAGQFSLANTVAVAQCAANLVLVGDQMQLAQPLQGTHPGESGQSALDYLLNGHATIPPDFGVFLNETRRLHPDICGFISEAVYEGRLHAHPDTVRHRVLVPSKASGHIQKEAGIVFVPVEHEGHSQDCEAEVDTIEEIVAELLGRKVIDSDGSTRKLKHNDIMIVAPFNLQVRQIESRLGGKVRVASVDKFQGQEAHVVILSMCSSTLEDSPRGAEFLMDPNRINVAVSRARSLAIVVGCPALLAARCQTIREMELVNLFCWLVDYSQRAAGQSLTESDIGEPPKRPRKHQRLAGSSDPRSRFKIA